jgi:hypothetical protein
MSEWCSLSVSHAHLMSSLHDGQITVGISVGISHHERLASQNVIPNWTSTHPWLHVHYISRTRTEVITNWIIPADYCLLPEASLRKLAPFQVRTFTLEQPSATSPLIFDNHHFKHFDTHFNRGWHFVRNGDSFGKGGELPTAGYMHVIRSFFLKFRVTFCKDRGIIEKHDNGSNCNQTSTQQPRWYQTDD